VPSNWPIHHTKQDVLAARYLKEKGINIQEKQYLRAVPNDVHDIIGGEQNRWWWKKVKDLRDAGDTSVNISNVYQKVPLADVEAFEAKLASEWSSHWVTNGAKSADVTRVAKKLEAAGGKFGLVAGEGQRLKRLGILAAAALPIFDLIVGWSNPAYAAVTLDAEHDAQLQNVKRKYEMCIDDALSPPTYRVSKINAQLLAEAVEVFVQRFDNDAAIRIRTTMGAYIDLNLP